MFSLIVFSVLLFIFYYYFLGGEGGSVNGELSWKGGSGGAKKLLKTLKMVKNGVSKMFILSGLGIALKKGGKKRVG